ncbi:protein of unknown function [Nitrospira defluvii]|uniref:Uncharacterized protein n=1 Tax=Nitrospira defluvii TaxID=330214 RepID=D8PES7_9BACT|nr:protein of unknown function [Nitrospira defluvii]
MFVLHFILVVLPRNNKECLAQEILSKNSLSGGNVVKHTFCLAVGTAYVLGKSRKHFFDTTR